MPNRSRRGLDIPILLLLLGLVLFASPLVAWWATLDRPWYLPYLLWGLLIAAAGILLQRSPGLTEDQPRTHDRLTFDHRPSRRLPNPDGTNEPADEQGGGRRS